MADDWREKVAFVRQLRPSTTHILLALLVAGRELTVGEILTMTGLSRKTVNEGLALLELQGHVAGGSGWALPAATQALFQSIGVRKVYSTSSSSSLPLSTCLESEGEKKKNGAKFTQNGKPDEVAALLRRAGVGRNSRKMGELLAAGLDARYVRQHVEAREARLERGEEYPVGWLITKLKDGDPVPAMPRKRANIIPEEYADVVVT